MRDRAFCAVVGDDDEDVESELNTVGNSDSEDLG